MKLVVDRKYKKQDYVISNLTIDGKWFCNVIEDTDRGLKSDMPLRELKSKKIANKTAIPSGIYKITLDVVSPKYSNNSYYKKVCNSKVPRLLNVPAFEGILIHTGNTEKDSSGCLIVGENKEKGKVINSRITFEKLYKELLKDKNNLTIEIK